MINELYSVIVGSVSALPVAPEESPAREARNERYYNVDDNNSF